MPVCHAYSTHRAVSALLHAGHSVCAQRLCRVCTAPWVCTALWVCRVHSVCAAHTACGHRNCGHPVCVQCMQCVQCTWHMQLRHMQSLCHPPCSAAHAMCACLWQCAVPVQCLCSMCCVCVQCTQHKQHVPAAAVMCSEFVLWVCGVGSVPSACPGAVCVACAACAVCVAHPVGAVITEGLCTCSAVCAGTAAWCVCLQELQAPLMRHSPLQGVRSLRGSRSSPAVSGCLRGAPSQGSSVVAPRQQWGGGWGEQEPCVHCVSITVCSGVGDTRRGWGPPLPSCSHLPASHLHSSTPARRGERGPEHLEHPPGAWTPQGTQHPIKISICPAQPCPTVPWSKVEQRGGARAEEGAGRSWGNGNG